MKKTAKTERPAQPISLMPRRHAFRIAADTSPHRSDWEASALKPIDSNRQLLSNTSMLRTMKKDLKIVKQDVEKLFCEENPSENHVNQKIEAQTLRDELSHCKQVEQELRRQLRQCWGKLQQQPDDRYKSDREKDIMNERLIKLQSELLEAQQAAQLKEDTKTQKLQQLGKDFDRVMEERNLLHDECGRLERLVEQLQPPKRNQETQHNEDEVLEVRRRMHEVEREKLAMAAKLKDRETDLRRAVEQHQHVVREKDAKYNSCLNEFKKLEHKLVRPKDDSASHLKERLAEVEQAFFNSKQACESLRNENTELAGKVERLRTQYEEQRHQNEEMAGKVRSLHNEIAQTHRHELLQLQAKTDLLEASLSEAQSRYQQKCREQQQLQQERIRSQTVIQPANDELHRTKVQLLTAEIQFSQLQGQTQRLREEFKALQELSSQKDSYIRELEKQREFVGHAANTGAEECRELYQDRTRIIEEYEQKILNLEIQLQHKTEECKQLRSETESMRQQQTPASFECSLKQQLTENEHLRMQLKDKNEELLTLRNQLEETRRRADNIKSQTELDKLRGITEQKTLKGHYEILLQNLRSDLQSQKRKYECLQRKADFRGEELRKKDEFIQQVIIGKMRPTDKSEVDFLREELSRFFSANYEGRLMSLQERIAELQTK